MASTGPRASQPSLAAMPACQRFDRLVLELRIGPAAIINWRAGGTNLEDYPCDICLAC